MSNFLGVPPIIRGELGAVHTEQMQPLGTRLNDNEGNVYTYLKGVDSTVDGSWVAYDEDGQTSLLTETIAAKLYPVAIATAIIVGDTYGWYMLAGTKTLALVKASCAHEVLLYATSTAGSLDDAGTTKIIGAIALTTVIGAGTTDVIINYPQPMA